MWQFVKDFLGMFAWAFTLLMVIAMPLTSAIIILGELDWTPMILVSGAVGSLAALIGVMFASDQVY